MQLKAKDSIDVTKMAVEAGFTGPVELTEAAWDELVTWSSASGLQDEEGRLWDVLWMGSAALRKSENPQEWLDFGVWRVPNTPRARVPRYAECRMNVTIDSAGQSSVTILLPEEARSADAVPDPYGQPTSSRPY